MFDSDNMFDLDNGVDFLEEFKFKVVKAYFGTDASYKNGTVNLMIWQGYDVETERQHHEFYSIGSGFLIKDNGAYIAHESGKKLKRSSVYGQLLTRIENEEIKGAKAAFKDQPKDAHLTAKIWENRVWLMGPVEEIEMKDFEPVKDENGKVKTVMKRKPVALLDSPAAVSSQPAQASSSSNEALLMAAKKLSTNKDEFIKNVSTMCPQVFQDPILAGKIFSGEYFNN